MALYRRIYSVSGIMVMLSGAALTPFLPYRIHDLPEIPYLTSIYPLFIINFSLIYFYTYKQSLIIVDQRQYVVTGWKKRSRYGAGVFLILTHSCFVYLGLQIGVMLLKNIIPARYADNRYPFLRAELQASPDRNTKQEIIRNIKALSIHNLRGATVFGMDNLLIADFLGLATVGVYSNYLMIVNGIKTFMVIGCARSREVSEILCV